MTYKPGNFGYSIAKNDDEIDRIFNRFRSNDSLLIDKYNFILKNRNNVNNVIKSSIEEEIYNIRNHLINKIKSLKKQHQILVYLLEYIDKLEDKYKDNDIDSIFKKIVSIEKNINIYNKLIKL